MAQSTKGRLNYRCPECFKRDIDMDMRCCFHGSEEEVLKRYDIFKMKYGRVDERVIDFGADNEPPKFVKHKAGEQ